LEPRHQASALCFPATHWTAIGDAADPDWAAARTALGRLVEVYRPALRAYLLAIKRIDASHADDLLQDFISTKFLEADLAATAKRGKGRFRTFLLTCLDRFLASEYRRLNTRKRGGGPARQVDAGILDLCCSTTPDPAHAFELAWARELLREVTRRMQAHCEETHQPAVWGIFECRILRPILEAESPVEYSRLARQFGLRSPMQAANALLTARRMFQRLLRETVAEYARSEAEIPDEIEDLHAILAGNGALRAVAKGRVTPSGNMSI